MDKSILVETIEHSPFLTKTKKLLSIAIDSIMLYISWIDDKSKNIHLNHRLN